MGVELGFLLDDHDDDHNYKFTSLKAEDEEDGLRIGLSCYVAVSQSRGQ